MNKIAMVVFNHYPADVRVRREAESLIKAGMSVDVICLQKTTQVPIENINGVQVYRINLGRKRSSKSRYLWEYTYFTLRAFTKLSALYVRNRYDIVHVHNMPETLVFSAILPRLAGAKIILDLHDPTPEVYMAKYSISHKHPVIRLLRALEKISIRFSNHVITPNIAFRNLFISRGCPKEKIGIIMNTPMEQIFFKNKANLNVKDSSKNGKFVVMYHGTIFKRHGLHLALEALTHLREEIPNLEFNVYGCGDFENQFLEYVSKLNLTKIVNFHGFVPYEKIAEGISSIDVGLIPNQLTTFTNLNLPTRIFEYLSMHKPVIVPKTKGILDYFDEDSIIFFEPDNINSLAETILKVYRNPNRQKPIVEQGIKVYNQHRWQIQSERLVKMVNHVLEQ